MREGLIPTVVVRADGDGVVLDGAAGEGGGQILRSALALGVISGKRVTVENIRAGRKLGGLLRQHLTAARAAAHISHGTLEGDALDASRLTLTPGPVTGGDYTFSVGTAGSSGLVFQTVLPALARAAKPSTLTLSGGTHNPLAPTFGFLRDAFAPCLQRMGVGLELKLHRAGFYPAGGGRWTVAITPTATLTPASWTERGTRVSEGVVATVAGVPVNVAEREVNAIIAAMGWPDDAASVMQLPKSQGPGNVVQIYVRHEYPTAVFTAFGERRMSAERVGRQASKDAKRYLALGAVISEHLADQLLLPMAMAGAGRMSTVSPSRHTLTNMAVIEAFLPVRFELEKEERDRFVIGVVS